MSKSSLTPQPMMVNALAICWICAKAENQKYHWRQHEKIITVKLHYQNQSIAKT